MYNSMPYCPYLMDDFRQTRMSYLRFLHAAPDTQAVDVYVNNNLRAKNLRYREFSKYIGLAPGLYNIRIVAANTTQNPIINTSLNIVPNMIATIAVIGYKASPAMEIVNEPLQPILPYRAYIRFVHLSPNAPNLDVGLPNGRKLFRDVQYREIEQYIDVNPGKYTLQLMNAGTGQLVLTVPNINFKPGKFYSIYAIGLTGAAPQLQVLIPLDGNTYLNTREILEEDL